MILGTKGWGLLATIPTPDASLISVTYVIHVAHVTHETHISFCSLVDQCRGLMVIHTSGGQLDEAAAARQAAEIKVAKAAAEARSTDRLAAQQQQKEGEPRDPALTMIPAHHGGDEGGGLVSAGAASGPGGGGKGITGPQQEGTEQPTPAAAAPGSGIQSESILAVEAVEDESRAAAVCQHKYVAVGWC